MNQIICLQIDSALVVGAFIVVVLMGMKAELNVYHRPGGGDTESHPEYEQSPGDQTNQVLEKRNRRTNQTTCTQT